MAIPVACVCGHEWPDLEGFEGQLVNCPRCGNTLRVPGKPRQQASGRLSLSTAGLRNANPTPRPTFAQAVTAEAAPSPAAAPPQPQTQDQTREIPKELQPPKPSWRSAKLEQEEKAALQNSQDESRVQANGLELIARHDPKLNDAATELLQSILRMAASGIEINEGLQIPYGWCILTVRAKGDQRRICAPDFSRNPYEHVQEDLTLALSIGMAQTTTCQKAGVRKPMPCLFTDEVLLVKNCLQHPTLCLYRRDFPTRGKTGWCIGARDVAELRNSQNKRLETLPGFRLLGRRDAVIHALSLPVNYTVFIEGDSIQSVLDPSEQQVWGR